MAKVTMRNKERKEPGKIKFNFDIEMLNVLIKYTQCEYVDRADLYSLRKLVSYMNIEAYVANTRLYILLNILSSILNSMVDLNLASLELITRQVHLDFPEGVDTLFNLNLVKNGIVVAECEYIKKFVDEKLQCIEIYLKKDRMISLLESIDDTADFNTSYYNDIQEIKQCAGELLLALQDNETEQGLLREFSFSDQDAAKLLARMHKKAKQPNAILQTGIRQLNAILSPGFHSGRLYTILGASGKFKSGTLLNITDQIRLFNPQIVPYENGMRKSILFITLENSIEETVERIYDMYSGMESDLRNMSPDEFIDTFKREGGFDFTGTNGGIDIHFRYAGNLEITTADIYRYVSDMQNKGKQPIAIVLDYIKRIDSAHFSNGDERVRMSFVAKELKTIAQFFNIPVITAMQLNREGNSIIDAAMRDNKQDVARFVGSSSIGNAWDIFEDSDWVALINLEMQKSTQRLFLTFKRLKIRGKKNPLASDYFNHPFINAKNIRLEPDVDKASPISVISLANDLESVIEVEDEGDKPNLPNLEQRNRDKYTSSTIIGSLKGYVKSN